MGWGVKLEAGTPVTPLLSCPHYYIGPLLKDLLGYAVGGREVATSVSMEFITTIGTFVRRSAEWIGKLAVQEVKYLANVRDSVEELKSELDWMQCFLLDADGKQNNDAFLRKRMSEISALALDAEEIIETYILKVSGNRGDENGMLYNLLRIVCFPRDAITLHKIGSQISSITYRISKHTLRLQTYGVRISYGSQSQEAMMTQHMLAEQSRTYSLDDANYVVGLEEQVDQVIHQLHGPQKIVVIYGIGGIGKTTLARQILNRSRSQGSFAAVAWAYVSQQPQVETICRDILNGLIHDETKTTNPLSGSVLLEKLSNNLSQKRCLVVLDDVWTAGDWNHLAAAFLVQNTSFISKLVITSRNPQLLSHLGELVSTWEVKPLGDPSDWKLLQNKGNFEEASLADPSMKDVARKMLNHCDGNPLAIVALGGVLATKKSLEEWESVSDNLRYYLQEDKLYNRVYEVLAMGYYELPYSVKPCFLHMGHFPEDFHIKAERIFNIWIGEGIVSLTQDPFGGTRTLEDIANNYLNLLVQKGMIQVVDMTVDGKIKTCSLHDLIRDKCLEITREENFLQVVDLQQQNASDNGDAGSGKVRRLTLHVGEKPLDSQSVLKASSGNVSSLRSFLFVSSYAEQGRQEFKSEWIVDLCKRFTLLRILDFEGVVLTGTLPREVGNLIYLTYLSLKGTHITEVPSSIGNLKSLLILDLRVKLVRVKLPNVLWKMSSLCHLYFPGRILSQEEDALGRDQGYVIEDGNNSLVLDNLTHLERIDNLDLDRVNVNGLLKLTNIRKLSATWKSEKGDLVNFLRSRNMKYLELRIDAGLLTEEHNLLSDFASLRILHVDAIREPPTFLRLQFNMFPRNLVELGFWYCRITEDPMPVLGLLPNLKTLHFCLCYRGESMYCSGTSFPELTFLELDGLNSLINWDVDEGGFPKLEKVGIYCLYKLNSIPNALPSNVSISCTPDLQGKVDQFRKYKGSEKPESSTEVLLRVPPSTW